MTDSERSLGGSVVICNQRALFGGADLPVPPDPGPERQQPLGNPHHYASRGSPAVFFERELPFKGVDDALDPLADRAEGAAASRLILAIGAEQSGPQLGRSCLQEAVGEAFVTDDDLALLQRAAIEERLRHLGFSQLRVGQTPVNDQAIGGGEQVQLEAPEVAGVAGAVTVVGVPAQGRAFHSLSTTGTGERGGIQKAEPVAPRRRLLGKMPKNPTEERRERPQALVVG